jgi:hypothetical protein
MSYDPVKDGERRKPENQETRNRLALLRRAIGEEIEARLKKLEDEPKPKPKPKPAGEPPKRDSWPL